MSTTEYVRTRWDRTQASLLCLGIAVASALPAWSAAFFVVAVTR